MTFTVKELRIIEVLAQNAVDQITAQLGKLDDPDATDHAVNALLVVARKAGRAADAADEPPIEAYDQSEDEVPSVEELAELEAALDEHDALEAGDE